MAPFHDNGKLLRRVLYWNFLNSVNRILAAKLNSKPFLLSVVKCFLKALPEGVWSLLFKDSQNQEKVSARFHGGHAEFLPHGWGLTSSADAVLPLGLNPELHGILEAQAQV